MLTVAGLIGRPRIGSKASPTLRVRKPEDETGHDHAVELLGTPRVGTQHTNRREAAGARHQQLDLAQLGQQMPSVRAVAPVGHVKRRHPIQVLVDGLVHLAGKNDGNRPAAETAVALAPLQSLRLHALH